MKYQRFCDTNIYHLWWRGKEGAICSQEGLIIRELTLRANARWRRSGHKTFECETESQSRAKQKKTLNAQGQISHASLKSLDSTQQVGKSRLSNKVTGWVSQKDCSGEKDQCQEVQLEVIDSEPLHSGFISSKLRN